MLKLSALFFIITVLGSANADIAPSAAVIQNFSTVSLTPDQNLQFSLDYVFSGVNLTYTVNDQPLPRTSHSVVATPSPPIERLKLSSFKDELNPASVIYLTPRQFTRKVINSQGAVNDTLSFTQTFETDTNISCYDIAEVNGSQISIVDCSITNNTENDVMYVIDYSSIPPKVASVGVSKTFDPTLKVLNRKLFTTSQSQLIRFTYGTKEDETAFWQVDTMTISSLDSDPKVSVISSLSSTNSTDISKKGDLPANFYPADTWVFYNQTHIFTYNQTSDKVISRATFPGELNNDLDFFAPSPASPDVLTIRICGYQSVTDYTLNKGMLYTPTQPTFKSVDNSTISSYIEVGVFSIYSSDATSLVTVSPTDTSSQLGKQQPIYSQWTYSGPSLRFVPISASTFVLCGTNSLNATTLVPQLLQLKSSIPTPTTIIATSHYNDQSATASQSINIVTTNTSINISLPSTVVLNYPEETVIPLSQVIQGSDLTVFVKDFPGTWQVSGLSAIDFSTLSTGLQKPEFFEFTTIGDTIYVYYKDYSTRNFYLVGCVSGSGKLTCNIQTAIVIPGEVSAILFGVSPYAVIVAKDQDNQYLAIKSDLEDEMLTFSLKTGICDVLHASQTGNNLLYCWSKRNASLSVFNLSSVSQTPLSTYSISGVTNMTTRADAANLLLIATSTDIIMLDISNLTSIQELTRATQFYDIALTGFTPIFAQANQIWAVSFNKSMVLRWLIVNDGTSTQLVQAGALSLTNYTLIPDGAGFFEGNRYVYFGVYDGLGGEMLLVVNKTSGLIEYSQWIDSKFVTRATQLANNDTYVGVWTERGSNEVYQISSNWTLKLSTKNISLSQTPITSYPFSVQATCYNSGALQTQNLSLVLYSASLPVQPVNNTVNYTYVMKEGSNTTSLRIDLDVNSIFRNQILDLTLSPQASGNGSLGDGVPNVTLTKPLNTTTSVDISSLINKGNQILAQFKGRNAFFITNTTFGTGSLDYDRPVFNNVFYQNISAIDPELNSSCGSLSAISSGTLAAFICGSNVYALQYSGQSTTFKSIMNLDALRQKQFLKLLATTDQKVFLFYRSIITQVTFPMFDIYDTASNQTASLKYSDVINTCPAVEFDPTLTSYGLDILASGNGNYKVFLSNYKSEILFLDISLNGEAVTVNSCTQYNFTSTVTQRDAILKQPVWEQFKVLSQQGGSYYCFVKSNNTFVYFLTLSGNTAQVQEAYVNYFHDSTVHYFEVAGSKLFTLVTLPQRAGHSLESYVLYYPIGTPQTDASAPYRYVKATQYLNLSKELGSGAVGDNAAFSYDDGSGKLLLASKGATTGKISNVYSGWTINAQSSNSTFYLQGENFASRSSVKVVISLNPEVSSHPWLWIGLGIGLFVIAVIVGLCIYRYKRKQAEKPFFYEEFNESSFA